MNNIRISLDILKLTEYQEGLFGVDINYENDVKYKDDIQILQKYAKNINEINIIIDFFHPSNFVHYFTTINSDIALLQNLSICNILLNVNCKYKHNIYTNYDKIVNINSKSIFYIFNDNMLFLIYKNNDNINSSIKYLNIMNINEDNINFLNNLPINIEYLHISSIGYYIDIFDNFNLPINLKKLKITLITFIIKPINLNIKLPFGCKLKINYIDYNT